MPDKVVLEPINRKGRLGTVGNVGGTWIQNQSLDFISPANKRNPQRFSRQTSEEIETRCRRSTSHNFSTNATRQKSIYYEDLPFVFSGP